MRPILCALGILTLVLPALGCARSESTSADGAVRDTLPDGTPIVRHAALGTAEMVVDLVPDLTLGSVDGEGADVFGDVRGIEAGPDGEIFVLDSQASEVRVFDPDGVHLRTLSRNGEGPGEIGSTNGFTRVADTLFVFDHAKWVILGLAVDDGRELVRYPTPVLSHGFIWGGIRDDRGRHWKLTTHSDAEQVYPPELGMNEGSARVYWKVFDPSTEAVDSVALGELTFQSFVRQFGNQGYSYTQVPFRSTVETIVDPAGGFWQVATEGYRIARLDASGDTTRVIEVDVSPRPVTDADRDAFVARYESQGPDAVRTASDMLEYAPVAHPVVESVFVAAERLWVFRTKALDERSRLDVFDREGGYRGSLRLPTGASEYLAPRIRGDRMYVLVQDDLGIPYVVRSPLPDGLVGG